MSKERIPELDILKGIGILFMLIGHRCAYYNMDVYGFIYSFHMPLFLFVSGFLYKERIFQEVLSKNFRHLVVPCLIALVIIYIRGLFIPFVDSNTFDSFQNFFYVYNRYLYAGWFLFSLFFALCILSFIGRRNCKYIFGLFLLPIIGLYIYKNSVFQFCILRSLTMLPFLLIGQCTRTKNLLEFSSCKMIIATILWFGSYYLKPSTMDMATCFYSWFYFGDVFFSFCSFYVLYNLIHYLYKNGLKLYFFSTIGRYSLPILWLHMVHGLDYWGFPWIGYYWRITKFMGDYSYGLGLFVIEGVALSLFVNFVQRNRWLKEFFLI